MPIAVEILGGRRVGIRSEPATLMFCDLMDDRIKRLAGSSAVSAGLGAT
jgi:hypothetical protein